MRVLAILALVGGCHSTLRAGDDQFFDASTSNGPDAPSVVIDAPAQQLDAPAAVCASGRKLFLNFDGVTLNAGGTSDATNNVAAWLGVSSAQIPQYKSGVSNRTTIISQVTAAITSQLASYPIQIVTTRPAAGPYVMIVFGGTPNTVNVPYIDAVNHLDCGDAVKSDVAIVFDNASPDTPQKAADFAIGALGFGMGLTGTTDPNNCMCSWLTNCTQGAGPCTLSAAAQSDTTHCTGHTNPQDQVAALQAFCQ